LCGGIVGAMASIWGGCPQLPGCILELDAAYAGDLGRTVASDDLFLVAIAELDETQPARQALAAEGIDAERLLAYVRVGGDGPLDPGAGLTYAPAYYAMEGRAQGFAAALGDGRITCEHVLLALLWDPGSTSSYLVWRLGSGRQRIVEGLRDLGVPTPRSPLPGQREVEWGDQVWFHRADVRRVVDYLRRTIYDCTSLPEPSGASITRASVPGRAPMRSSISMRW
jgi:Clp amino terminal domain, pathogenicity island component